MKDALKNIGADIAAEIVSHFESDAVRTLLDQTKAASDSEAGTFEVVITTENLDRYQEVIKLDGWELEHYRKNPVVLWGHDHNSPIGVATSIEITDGKMVAKGKFAPTEKAQEVRKLYDFGIIRATSVGFIEKEREGNLITKAELLEFSFVSVPANPYALSLAMEKALSLDGLVTKGFMHVEKSEGAVTCKGVGICEDGECDHNEPAPTETVPPTVPESEVKEEERNFSTKQLSPVIDSLKAAVVALEALGVKSEEPEGDEPVVEDDEEQRAYKEFSEKRRILQEASTIIGDVLADARRAIDRSKAA